MSYTLAEVEREMNDVDSINAKISEIFDDCESYAEYMDFDYYNEQEESVRLSLINSYYKVDVEDLSIFCAGAIAQCEELEKAMLDNIQNKYGFQYDSTYQPDFDSEDFVSIHKFVNSVLSVACNTQEVDIQDGLNFVFGNSLSESVLTNLVHDFSDYITIRNDFYELCESVYPDRSPDEIQAMVNVAVVYDMDEYSDICPVSKSEYLREYALMADTDYERDRRNLAAELAFRDEYMQAHFRKNIHKDYDRETISSYPLLSSKFIRNHESELDWNLISKNKVFSKEDISEFKDFINFDLLKFNPYLSEDIIRKEHIDMSYLLQTPEFKHAKEVADSIDYFDYIEREDDKQTINYVFSSQPNNLFAPKLTCYNNATKQLTECMGKSNPLEGPASLKMGEAKPNLFNTDSSIIVIREKDALGTYLIDNMAELNPEQFKLFVENYETGVKSLSQEKTKDLEKDTILRDDDACK